MSINEMTVESIEAYLTWLPGYMSGSDTRRIRFLLDLACKQQRQLTLQIQRGNKLLEDREHARQQAEKLRQDRADLQHEVDDLRASLQPLIDDTQRQKEEIVVLKSTIEGLYDEMAGA